MSCWILFSCSCCLVLMYSCLCAFNAFYFSDYFLILKMVLSCSALMTDNFWIWLFNISKALWFSSVFFLNFYDSNTSSLLSFSLVSSMIFFYEVIMISFFSAASNSSWYLFFSSSIFLLMVRSSFCKLDSASTLSCFTRKISSFALRSNSLAPSTILR